MSTSERLTADAPERGATRPILVVGGSGRVGSIAAERLAADPRLRVLIGSRHPSEHSRHTAVRVDVTDAEGVRDVLRRWRPSVVVLCVDAPDGSFHAACLEEGASVVDVTASVEQFATVEALAPRAREHGKSIVLSVGVAPGLTNALARLAVSALGGHAEQVELTVMAGSREEHGAEAVRWTIDGILQPGAEHSPARRVDVPGTGRRTAHFMPFADQVSLRRTLGVPSVTTRLSLDSRAFTWLLFGFGRSRVGRRMLGTRAGRAALTGASGRLPIGGEDFVVLAEAEDHGRRAAWWVRGRSQSRATGLVAAIAARHVAVEHVPAGVWHLDQLPALLTELVELENDGLVFDGTRTAPDGASSLAAAVTPAGMSPGRP